MNHRGVLFASDPALASAIKAMPSLIKAYLRLGGYVGDGAYVDHAFNTTDVCLILDTQTLNEKQKNIYSKGVTG